MHLVKTFVIVARASRLALGAPSQPARDAAVEDIQARASVDHAQADDYAAADYESMMDDLATQMAGEGKSKEKYCRECHKICIAVSPIPPAVAA